MIENKLRHLILVLLISIGYVRIIIMTAVDITFLKRKENNLANDSNRGKTHPTPET